MPMASSVQLQRTTNNPADQKPTWVVPVPATVSIPGDLLQRHIHAVAADQCCSAVIRTIRAPVDAVWSVVRRFDNPQAYKHFLKSCRVIAGEGDVGSLREVEVISGMPAAGATERLEILDDERHVFSFRVIGGQHRLQNYKSVTTLHSSPEHGGDTVVVESYVVDVPQGNTAEETSAFANTIVRCNLQALAQIVEKR